jgi:acetate kinase
VRVLVVNAGSSSLKLRLLDDADRLLASRDLPSLGATELGTALDAFLDESPGADAAGHRVVHGGALFQHPVVLDAAVDESLERLTALAPLHNPPSLAAIDALRSLLPDLPQVACFDTTFHAAMPAKAATYAVPRTWRQTWGVRRYGFHGLSHAWATRRAAELMGIAPSRLRLVTAHLGAGASLAAVDGGISVDTTMGFTPMEGLVMATRSGTVDPGLILWIQKNAGLSAPAVEQALEHESGLLGLSGRSGDLRQVIDAADRGDEASQLAYDVYVYRIQTSVAAMTAALGGLHGLVFTGGAGESSARLRTDVCAGLGFLGLTLEDAANHDLDGDGSVSGPGVAPTVLVVHAREDLEIARHVRDLLA